MNLPRRRFVRLLTFGCASSVIAGQWWQREVLAYCNPLPGQKDAGFKIRISDFPALSQDWGSVRIGINPVRPDAEPFPDGSFYPFLINRDDAGNFYVLDCECRHESCVVPAFDANTLSIECPCHGSRYGVDGGVLNGPTQFPLHAYPFEYDGGDLLTIHVPCWGFETKLSVLTDEPAARVKLEFPTQDQVTYEVLFSASPTGPWAVAGFSTTPTEPATQTSIKTFGGSATLYLDRVSTTGFYAVGMQLSEV